MAPLRSTISSRACDGCRRRKVKCDSTDSCANCRMSNLTCEYTVLQRRRGPRSHTVAHRSQWHGSLPTAAEGLQRRLHTERATQTEDSPASLDSDQESRADLSSPSTWQESTTTAPNAVSTSSQTSPTAEAAHAVWAALLSSISTAVPSMPVKDIANRCIDLYMQYAFPSAPILHEATARNDALILFSDTTALVTLFALHDEHQTVARMRAFALLTGLCASVSSVMPGSLLAYGSVIPGPFLRASRDMLHIYEEYDFEYPNSSSLSIRHFHATAYQSTIGKTGAAFSVLGQATLIARSLQLHREESVIREDLIESQLLRFNFWVLYLSDKSAATTGTRPCVLHEYLFNGDLTLHPRGEPFTRLLDASLPRYQEPFEERLMAGFQLIPRLWSAASTLILDMNAYGKMGADRESHTTRMSREYLDFVSILDDLPSWLEVSNLVATPNDDALVFQKQSFWQQRCTIMMTFHCVRLLILQRCIDSQLWGIMGLHDEPLSLAMRKVEVIQNFVQTMNDIPFIYHQVKGEPSVERIRLVGSITLEMLQTIDNEPIRARVNSFFRQLLDSLANLNSKASETLGWEPQLCASDIN